MSEFGDSFLLVGAKSKLLRVLLAEFTFQIVTTEGNFPSLVSCEI